MRLVASASAALFLLGCGVSFADSIGAATVAKNEVKGELGEVVRAVTAGVTVSANEKITTGIESSTLLEFLDKSNLTIGASSAVVLDKFVFNPDEGAQQVVLNLTKGAMRFVSSGTEPEKFTIQTPVATLGVRGTDFITICDDEGKCAVLMNTGRVEVCPVPLAPELREQAPQERDCPEAYNIDRVRNFTLIRANGRNTGAQIIPRSVVRSIIQAVTTGKDPGDLSVLASRAAYEPANQIAPVEPRTKISASPK